MKKLLVLLSITLLFSFAAISQTVTLAGSGADLDGTISSYAWRKISGPASGIITSPTSAVTTVTGLTAGVYQYELTVIDNQGATGTDTVQVTVIAGNIRPKANAGQDQIITLPTTGARLKGDGSGTTFEWKEVSGPPAKISFPHSKSTSVTGLTSVSNYQFSFNTNLLSPDTMNVTVKDVVDNIRATKNAGSVSVHFESGRTDVKYYYITYSASGKYFTRAQIVNPSTVTIYDIEIPFTKTIKPTGYLKVQINKLIGGIDNSKPFRIE